MAYRKFPSAAGLRMSTSAGVLALALCAPLAVQAQDTAPAPAAEEAFPADAGEDDDVEAIVVTGSRIARSGFDTPAPVTVLDNARTENLAISNVADALNQLPSFRASAGPANQQTAGGAVGARILDLRGLGAPRTLVLVDGRRFVPSTAEGTVDVNLIPSILVERTEVVTGGVSAVYGSDAVAGVVNFILDRNLEGLKAEIQGGISERGDDENIYGGAAWGTRIGDRGHFVIAGEYERNWGLGGCYEARDWCAQEPSIVGNTPAGTAGMPSSIITSDVHTSTLYPGGVINRSFDANGVAIGSTATDPLRGIKFLPDGTPAEFQYGQFAGPLFMIGGDGHGTNAFLSGVLLKVPVERYSTYASLQYDLTDNVQAFADLSYGRVKGTTRSSTFRDFNGSLMGNIRIDNPYIPAAVRDEAIAAGVSSFTLGKAWFDFGSPQAVSTNETIRGVVGVNADLGNSWRWETYYQFGRNSFHQDISNDPINANVRRAVDAVQVGNSVVCRVNADADPTNDDPACRPLNLFGQNLFDPAALDYVLGEGFQRTVNKQHVIATNLSGELFYVSTRPVGVSIGAEWRRNTIDGSTDPISENLGFWVLNGQAVNGAQSVKEIYGEVVVPLAENVSFADDLELNGAIRLTDYSTSGSVTTWKIGGVYAPIPSLRFRVTRSRDIRAPNVNELFGPLQKGTIGLTDPKTGNQANPVLIRGSNPALSVERSDSFTAGVIITPESGFLSRFRFSADYFNLTVEDAIGLLGAQTLVERCEDGATEFCSLITRDATDAVVEVQDILLNANSLKTKGFELELAYNQDIGTDSELDLRVLSTITQDLITIDSAGATDRAGQTGSRAGTVLGVPDYTIDGVASFRTGGTRITAHARYIPSGMFNVAFIGPDDPDYDITLPTSVTDNTVPDRFYLNLAFTQEITVGGDRQFEIFGAVNNVFDRDPPALPSGNLGTNQVLFDPIGRAFKLGARVNFGG